MENRTINGWDFKYDEDNEMYECRGDVYYDDDHDEQPEPSLLTAAMKLEIKLIEEGYLAEVSASEKGWVEVQILKKNK
jgi:hypothetical protein